MHKYYTTNVQNTLNVVQLFYKLKAIINLVFSSLFSEQCDNMNSNSNNNKTGEI